MFHSKRTPARCLSALTLALLLMMTCLIPACSAAEPAVLAAPENVVRVLLTKIQAAQQLSVEMTGYYIAEGWNMTLSPGAKLTLTIANGQMVLHSGALTMPVGQQLVLRRRQAEDGSVGGLYLNGSEGCYEGDLQLDVLDGAIRAILHIGVEDYLMGVVPYEMSNSFPLEALKVQAVAARTYALRKRDTSRAYDVTDNTNDQVYYGRVDSYTNAIAAVEATRGICGYYKGSLATCYYSASNGGQTELVENVWGDDGADHAYVDVRNDPYDLENPRSLVARYSIAKKPGEKGVGTALHEAIVTQLSEELESHGYDTQASSVRIDEVCSVKLGNPKFEAPSRLYTTITLELMISARRVLEGEGETDDWLAATPTPTVEPTAQPTQETASIIEAQPTPEPVRLSALIEWNEPVTVTLGIFDTAEAAMNLSISFMKNELWTVAEQGDAFVVEARRYGHGVGMSQRGAEWMAGRYGKTYEEILAFYYPGMEFRQVETASATPQPLDLTYLATPAPSPSPTPRPTLMPLTLDASEGLYIALVANIDDDSSLNLRMEPSFEADVRRRLLKGQRLLVEEELEGGWVKVRTDVTEGYVMAEYLEKEEPAQ